MNGFPIWAIWALVIATIAGILDVGLYLTTDAIHPSRKALVKTLGYLSRAALLVFGAALSIGLIGIAFTLIARK